MRKKLLLIQIALASTVVIAFFIYQGLDAAASAAYGGGIAVINGLLLVRRIFHANEVSKQDANSGATVLFIGIIERILVTLVGLGVGMGLLKLAPLPMIVAFAAAQVAFMIIGKQDQMVKELR